MAGFEGRVKGILCERELLLERRTGHTLHLDLASIARLKHHHTSLLPRWVLIIGLSSIYGAWRVFIGQPAIALLSFGLAVSIMFFLGRRPTITIDTTSGDCHIIYANDASLMRLTYLTKRLRNGSTLKDARIGLELLKRENDYPSTTPIENSLFAAEKPNIETPSALSQFLQNNTENEAPSAELLPAWAAEDSGEGIMLNEPAYTEIATPAMNQPESTRRAIVARQEMNAQRQHQDQLHDPWGQHNSQHNSQPLAMQQHERDNHHFNNVGMGMNAQQTQNYRNDSYQTQQSNRMNPSPHGLLAASNQMQQPNEVNDMFAEGGMFGDGGMFGEGGMFDEPKPSDSPAPWNEPMQQNALPNQAMPQNHLENNFNTPIGNPGQGGFHSTRWQEGDTRQPSVSSLEMIRRAQGELPPVNSGALHPHVNRQPQQGYSGQPTSTPETPTFLTSFPPKLEHGQRQNDLVGFSTVNSNSIMVEEPETAPIHNIHQTGLVAGARLNQDEGVIEAEIISEGDPLSAFPRMRELAASRAPGRGRLKFRPSILRRKKSSSGIRNMTLPTISDVVTKLSSARRRIMGRNAERGDGYAQVYGDPDGYAGDQYAQENFQTGQSLRTISDQAYQAQIKNDIQRLSENNGGNLDDETLLRMLRHISEGEVTQQQYFTAGPEVIPTSFSELSSTTEKAERSNDIPGLTRIDG
jgi:hypothetical protein